MSTTAALASLPVVASAATAAVPDTDADLVLMGSKIEKLLVQFIPLKAEMRRLHALISEDLAKAQEQWWKDRNARARGARIGWLMRKSGYGTVYNQVVAMGREIEPIALAVLEKQPQTSAGLGAQSLAATAILAMSCGYENWAVATVLTNAGSLGGGAFPLSVDDTWKMIMDAA